MKTVIAAIHIFPRKGEWIGTRDRIRRGITDKAQSDGAEPGKARAGRRSGTDVCLDAGARSAPAVTDDDAQTCACARMQRGGLGIRGREYPTNYLKCFGHYGASVDLWLPSSAVAYERRRLRVSGKSTDTNASNRLSQGASAFR